LSGILHVRLSQKTKRMTQFKLARIKLGDIFSVEINDHDLKYFQYVANDLNQLNSDVIRVFAMTNSNTDIDLIKLANSEVEFYAHCLIKLGTKMDCWKKVGNVQNVGSLDIFFRNTNDYGAKPGEQIKISDKWFIWKVWDNDYTRVGNLTGDHRKAEIGIVINPFSIVHRIKTGGYDFSYPDYE